MSVPPPPPENPIVQLKRHHTAPELKKELERMNLNTNGTKTDMSLRLVMNSDSFITLEEIGNEYTVQELRKRVKPSRKMSKSDLCKEFMENI